MTPRGDDFLVLGHECLARIESVGAKVDNSDEASSSDEAANADDLAVGDIVVPLVRRARGDAPFRPDMLAMGDYTERGIVEEHGFARSLWLDQPRHLIPVPPSLGDLAVLTEPMSVAEKAFNEAIQLQQARLGDAIWTDPAPRVLVASSSAWSRCGVC